MNGNDRYLYIEIYDNILNISYIRRKRLHTALE